MRLVRAVCAVAFTIAFIAASAVPAAAHGIGGREPTNVRSRILDVVPALPGLGLRLLDNGESIELTNTSDIDVTVVGYEGEPYLRVGPRGVFENVRSPAVYLNRTLDPPSDVPSAFDAEAEPEWRAVSNANRARWHDHRAHRMGSGSFPTTQWTIPLAAEDQPITVRGELAWVEPAPWWPFLVLAAGIIFMTALAARRAWRLTVTLVLALLCFAEVLHMVGSWSEVATTFAGRVVAQMFSIIAVAVGVVAFQRTARDEPSASAPFVLVAGIIFVVAGGVSDVSSWFRSQLPSTLPGGTVRALVALALGAGVGLVLAAASRLAASPTRSPDPDRELA